MSAAQYNLVIPRGADFNFTLRVLDANDDPVSFSGSADFKAEIREAHKRPLVAAFAFETLSGAGASTVNNALVDGEIKFILTDTQTLALDVSRKYEWDFYWTDSGGLRYKLLYGSVTVEPNITNL